MQDKHLVTKQTMYHGGQVKRLQRYTMYVSNQMFELEKQPPFQSNSTHYIHGCKILYVATLNYYHCM